MLVEGLFFIGVTLPGHVPDIWAHVYRVDGYDPAVVIPESVKDGSNSTVDLPFNNTAVNSPVVYAPQLVGFAAGRVLSLSAGITYYLAEVCMLGVYVLLMYCSVRVLPKWTLSLKEWLYFLAVCCSVKL